VLAGTALAIAFGIPSAIALTPAHRTTTTAPATKLMVLSDPRITESSGLARSAYTPTRLWTHNDSGGGTAIYAIGPQGRTTATYHLVGASHHDWEAISSATRNGVGYLYLGDIGDNHSKRSTIAVHRVREPRPGASLHLLTPTTYRFVYPDGPHNAETLMVRPGSMRIYIVTKGKGGPGAIYAAPRRPATTGLNHLQRIGPAPEGMADGTFLNRHRFVLRGYVSGWLYDRLGSTPVRFPLPIKGESITKAPQTGYVLVGAEGRSSPVWQVRLP
jgi:hypothetical protein